MVTAEPKPGDIIFVAYDDKPRGWGEYDFWGLHGSAANGPWYGHTEIYSGVREGKHYAYDVASKGGESCIDEYVKGNAKFIDIWRLKSLSALETGTVEDRANATQIREGLVATAKDLSTKGFADGQNMAGGLIFTRKLEAQDDEMDDILTAVDKTDRGAKALLCSELAVTVYNEMKQYPNVMRWKYPGLMKDEIRKRDYTTPNGLRLGGDFEKVGSFGKRTAPAP
jgi:hypothetical protein